MGFFDYTSLEDSVVHGLTLFERLLPVIILVVVLVLINRYYLKIRNFKSERKLMYVIGALMLFGELSFMAWNYTHSLDGSVYFIGTLPFQLCSYAIWGIAFVMFTKNKKVYNYVFMFSITGVLALVFPNLNHGFNSFRYYQLYFSHSLLIIGTYYLYKVHGFYPRKKALINSFIFLQVLIVLSIGVNILLDTDFLFIGPGNKPIDFAWEWPWHMIEYELGMAVFYFVTYLIIKRNHATTEITS